MMGTGSKHNIQISSDSAKPSQHGVYDPRILCAECDGKLGALDDIALDVCRNFAIRHIPLGDDCFEMPNVDGNAICKFVLAVLWRGSISSRPECEDIGLGPYENRARDVLFGSCALSQLWEFELLILRLRENAKFQSRLIYTFPTPDKSTGVNRWGFVAGGFRFVCKMDKRPWSGLPQEYLKLAVVNGKDRLFGMFADFEETAEHRGALFSKRADLARRASKLKG
jgi:hypothetical protein